jgi:uncharacterized protein
MKLRRLLFGYLFLLVGLVALPQARAQQATPSKAAHNSLWKVEGKANTVYLLGSVHVLKAGDYPLPQPMETAFSNAAIVVFETEIGKMEEPGAQFKLMSKARLPEGETLEQRLSAETYKLFTEKLKECDLPVEMFEQYKPAMAATMVTVLQLQALGFDPNIGIDKHFYDLARKQGKEVRGLETLDFQIGLLTDFSREEDELVLKATIKEMDQTKKEFGEILKAWRTGDAEKLGSLLNDAVQEAPSVFKRLITDRNQRWVPQLEELTRTNKNVIVIVGAGHLVGKEGVVELLKKKGLKLSQQ